MSQETPSREQKLNSGLDSIDRLAAEEPGMGRYFAESADFDNGEMPEGPEQYPTVCGCVECGELRAKYE